MRAWCITSVLALPLEGLLSLSAVSAVIGIVCSARFLRRVSQPILETEIAAGVQVWFPMKIALP